MSFPSLNLNPNEFDAAIRITIARMLLDHIKGYLCLDEAEFADFLNSEASLYLESASEDNELADVEAEGSA